MEDFDVWFEVKKVTSGKGKLLEPLRNLFEECWNKASEKVTELENRVEELQESFDEEKEGLYTEESLSEKIEEIKSSILEEVEGSLAAFQSRVFQAISNSY